MKCVSHTAGCGVPDTKPAPEKMYKHAQGAQKKNKKIKYARTCIEEESLRVFLTYLLLLAEDPRHTPKTFCNSLIVKETGKSIVNESLC